MRPQGFPRNRIAKNSALFFRSAELTHEQQQVRVIHLCYGKHAPDFQPLS
jgi:hypothetical protein